MMAGVQSQQLVRSYLVYDMTDSAFLLGVVNAASALPMLFLSLFGGALADRLDRKRLIQAGQGAIMVIAVAVAVLVYTGTVQWWHILIASALQGAMFSFVAPARQSIIPELVGKDRLGNAVAMTAAAMSAMTFAAPAMAGVLYAVIGPGHVFMLIGLTMLIAMVLTASIPATAARLKPKNAMMADIKAGMSYIRRTPIVLVLLGVGLSTVMLIMPFRFLLPVFVVDVYHRESGSLGLLLSILGLGSLAGSIGVAAIGRKNRGLLLIMGGFAAGISMLLIALIPIYYVAAVIMLALGLSDAGHKAINLALVMENSDEQFRGRVVSVWMLNWGLMPLGMLPMSLAIDLLGDRLAIGIIAGIVLAMSVAIMLTQKKLRALQ